MGNIEITVRLYYLAEIVIIEPVGNQLHRRAGHGLELLLDERGYGHHYGSVIQDLLLQFVMPALSPSA